jgi:hypothetical protein
MTPTIEEGLLARLGFGEQRSSYGTRSQCREFLGQRRGGRRLESIRKVVAAAVG